jgi:hypothetical protein
MLAADSKLNFSLFLLLANRYVKLYAADEKKFFNDFSVAFHKLEELGTKNLVPAQWA